jgi:hypothetical protein
MRRFLFSTATLAALGGATIAAAGALVVAACTSTATPDREPVAEDSGPKRDGGLVGPAEAGAYDAGTALGPEPNCATYCGQVMSSCTGAHAQYASGTECLELCQRLPAGDAGDTETNSVACRQYYAGSPARTSAGDYCLAAGPFGGGVCGDRCIAFCALTLGACSPDTGGPAPYGSYPDCQTACSGFPYLDGGADGGGEPPDGPEQGNTLNCRLFHVRSAVHDGSGCVDLGADSGACR